MIYSVEIQNGYDAGQLLMVSDSLKTCIDACNNYNSFPFLGEMLKFTFWNNSSIIGFALIRGNRENQEWYSLDDVTDVPEFIPVTIDEVLLAYARNPKNPSL